MKKRIVLLGAFALVLAGCGPDVPPVPADLTLSVSSEILVDGDTATASVVSTTPDAGLDVTYEVTSNRNYDNVVSVDGNGAICVNSDTAEFGTSLITATSTLDEDVKSNGVFVTYGDAKAWSEADLAVIAEVLGENTLPFFPLMDREVGVGDFVDENDVPTGDKYVYVATEGVVSRNTLDHLYQIVERDGFVKNSIDEYVKPIDNNQVIQLVPNAWGPDSGITGYLAYVADAPLTWNDINDMIASPEMGGLEGVTLPNLDGQYDIANADLNGNNTMTVLVFGNYAEFIEVFVPKIEELGWISLGVDAYGDPNFGIAAYEYLIMNVWDASAYVGSPIVVLNISNVVPKPVDPLAATIQAQLDAIWTDTVADFTLMLLPETAEVVTHEVINGDDPATAYVNLVLGGLTADEMAEITTFFGVNGFVEDYNGNLYLLDDVDSNFYIVTVQLELLMVSIDETDAVTDLRIEVIFDAEAGTMDMAIYYVLPIETTVIPAAELVTTINSMLAELEVTDQFIFPVAAIPETAEVAVGTTPTFGIDGTIIIITGVSTEAYDAIIHGLVAAHTEAGLSMVVYIDQPYLMNEGNTEYVSVNAGTWDLMACTIEGNSITSVGLGYLVSYNDTTGVLTIGVYPAA
ncbi:MAG: hypothetical protein LBR37_02780 [Erysipelotrichaceae bacterium]|jgi:hypothetical protein|nr:hypothetical protein [Erysipelotrichaceae bacterium]